MRQSRTVLSAASLCLAAAALTGCSTTDANHAGDIESIRSNPSPAMLTAGRRHTDIINQRTVTFDTDLRLFVEDLNSALHIDRPSHLSPYPKMH